jgi:hypothetical protein
MGAELLSRRKVVGNFDELAKLAWKVMASWSSAYLEQLEGTILVPLLMNLVASEMAIDPESSTMK